MSLAMTGSGEETLPHQLASFPLPQSHLEHRNGPCGHPQRHLCTLSPYSALSTTPILCASFSVTLVSPLLGSCSCQGFLSGVEALGECRLSIHLSRSQENSTWTLHFHPLSDSLTLYTLICQKKRDHPPSEVFSQKTALVISGLDTI